MASFWDRVAGGSVPAPPPAPAPQTAAPPVPGGGAWWKPQPQPQPQQQAQEVPIYDASGRIVGFRAVDAPQQPQQAPQPGPEQPVTTKAKSAKIQTTCPNCDSGNCFQPLGMPNAMMQCYECGWNPRFEQQASGMPADKSLPVHAARQAGTDRNNFNSQTYKVSEGGAGVVTL